MTATQMYVADDCHVVGLAKKLKLLLLVTSVAAPH
jgi:hypothetical protein